MMDNTKIYLNNIFDQYEAEENKITGALLQTLANNRSLLKFLLNNIFRISLKKYSKVIISSQKNPFLDEIHNANKVKLETVPDGWIVIDSDKVIVIESKIIKNNVKFKQLNGHIKNIPLDIPDKYLLVLSPDYENPLFSFQSPDVKSRWLSWKSVYDLINGKKYKKDLPGFLKKQLKEYLAMKENLIGFRGIEFNQGEYTPREAKIIIKGLIQEIKPEFEQIFPDLKFQKKSLSEHTHAYSISHRGVWTFLGANEDHTKDLHFTFWISETHFGMGLTVPNNAKPRWKRLKQIFKNNELFKQFLSELFKLRKSLPNITLEFLHRHYLNQKDGIVDGFIEIDLDTIKGNKSVKKYPVWISAIQELVANKKNFNGQLMIRTRYFHKDHPKMKKTEFKSTILQVAQKFHKVYDLLVE